MSIPFSIAPRTPSAGTHRDLPLPAPCQSQSLSAGLSLALENLPLVPGCLSSLLVGLQLRPSNPLPQDLPNGQSGHITPQLKAVWLTALALGLATCPAECSPAPPGASELLVVAGIYGIQARALAWSGLPTSYLPSSWYLLLSLPFSWLLWKALSRLFPNSPAKG